MPFGWGYSVWFEAAPKAMRGAIGAKALMDGVIVAVAHEEFRRMGMENVGGMFDARADEGGVCYRGL